MQANPTKSTSQYLTLWRSTARICVVTVLGISFTAIPAHDALAKVRSKHASASARHLAAHKAPRKVRVAAKRTAPITMAATEPVTENNSEPPAAPFQILTRNEILVSDADRLERAGRHLIVGYHSFAEVKLLVEKRAIAGIFITDHNVEARNASAIKADIDTLQAIRKTQALPPLIVAADQEGGSVSRLSPPLKPQRSLGYLLRERKIVEAYAETQATELKRLGVTLNFAPVVDLKLNPANRNDGETRLRLRAIDADPFTVAKVAGWYCDVFAKAGLMCTLKHFPGLGRVSRDTHIITGEIAASQGQLELNDWVPFRRVMSQPNAVTMIGHVRIGAIDGQTPASYSKPVIRDLIRSSWGYDGLLVTDDFSMGAITSSRSGIGRAAVKSLDAGVDLVLVSYIEKHFDIVMSALLAADADGRVDAVARSASRERIARVIGAAAGFGRAE
jgi:beta-N-acetylhexosaminidase